MPAALCVGQGLTRQGWRQAALPAVFSAVWASISLVPGRHHLRAVFFVLQARMLVGWVIVRAKCALLERIRLAPE